MKTFKQAADAMCSNHPKGTELKDLLMIGTLSDGTIVVFDTNYSLQEKDKAQGDMYDVDTDEFIKVKGAELMINVIKSAQFYKKDHEEEQRKQGSKSN